MFLIINVVEGSIGRIFQRDTWEQAVEKAAEQAFEQCDVSLADIKAELEEDRDFLTPDETIRVVIAQAETD
jgi:hypothetical protein